MPEGDTIHKLARALEPELRGERIAQLRIRRQPPTDLVGHHIAAVTSLGKHLYIAIDDGRMIRSHLGLYGSWHRYRLGEPWRKPEHRASLVLQTATRVYVCFNAKDIEILRDGGPRARDQRARLGPDLTADIPSADRLASLARTLSAPERLIVDVLLDQRIAAGIGNVYKSEVLFLQAVAPASPIESLEDATIARLYTSASALLRANLGGGPRITRHVADGRGGLWVYRRAGDPCFRCGESIVRAMLGQAPRSTYWCPSCQPERAPAPRPADAGL